VMYISNVAFASWAADEPPARSRSSDISWKVLSQIRIVVAAVLCFLVSAD